MLAKQIKTRQIVEKKLLNSIKHNINHFQFIRKRNLVNKQKSTIFSNTLLKTLNSLEKNMNDTEKRIQNSYSPKKIKPTSVLYLKMKSMNPYKLAVEQNRKIQNLVFSSLQKSIQIKRQPISMNFSRQLTSSRSRKSIQKVHKQSTSQVDIFVKSYVNLAIQNPQPLGKRTIKSAERRRISLPAYRSQSSLLNYVQSEKCIKKL